MSEPENTTSERSWVDYVIVGLLAAIVAGLLANLVFQILQEHRDESQTADIHRIDRNQVDQNSALINTLSEAQEAACERETTGRIEGRQRGKTIEILLETLINLAQGAPVAQTNPELVADSVRTLNYRLSLLDVLPLPNCGAVAEQLRQDLGHAAKRSRSEDPGGGDANTASSGGGRRRSTGR